MLINAGQINSVGQNIILKNNSNERTAVNSHYDEITCFGLETNIEDIFMPYHYVILRLICGMNPGALPSGSTPLYRYTKNLVVIK